MLDILTPSLAAALYALAALGCVYTLAAAVAVRRFAGADATATRTFPGVTILKPLRGAEGDLHTKLAAFCDQDYPGSVQILFGVHDAADPAVAVVERLIAARPGREMQLLVGSEP